MKTQKFYVEMDARDNSVSLSTTLFDHITENHDGDAAKIYAFYIPERSEYGFVVNPVLPQDTIVSDIQYNDHCKQVGFELLCPSVNLIFYRYGITTDTATLEVDTFTLPDGTIVYSFVRP